MKFQPTLSKIIHTLLLLTLLTSFSFGSAAPFNPPRVLAAAGSVPQQAPAGFGSPVVDGVIDPLYGDPIASDPADAPQGNFPMDLLALYAAQDAAYVYFAFTVNTDLAANNWGKYALYLDTTNDANGATSDAWGRNVIVNDPHKPEFAIYSWVDSPPYDTGHTQVVPWNQGTTAWDWGSASQLSEAAIGAGSTSVIEWKLAKSAIGSPETIWIEVWDTGGGGGDNAQDTINNPADDWNATDWGSQADLDVSTQFGAPLIDGERDQIWGSPIAEDPLGDMSEVNLDLNGLYLVEDADNYYLGFDAFASNWGMTYGIYLDTDLVDGSGATSDPWGRAVAAVSAHLPEYALYVFHNDNDTLQDAQLTTWNGSGWDYPTLGSVGGAQGYGAANDWIEYKIPKAALGSPAHIALEAFTTGSNGHAQDSVPSDPNVAYDDPDWSGDTTTLSAFLIYPPQSLALSVTAPGEGQAFAVPGMDVTGEVSPAEGVTVTVDLNSAAWFTPALDASGAFTQPVTLIAGSNTITVTATDGSNTEEIVRHVTYGASQDDNIWWSELGHNSRDGLYRTPFGAVVSSTVVTLRLRAAANDLTGVKVRLYNDRTNAEMLADMTRVVSDGTHEYWAYTFNVGVDPTVYWYRFIVSDGSATAYYEDDAARMGGWGQTFGSSQDNSWQLTVYDPAYHTPDWVKNAVIYQVFTDRFRDGDETNNPAEGEFFYDDPRGTTFRSNTADWNAAICDPRDDSDPACTGTYSQNFYGGDLQGLIDKLDYLETLGVTAIYLNPIFEAPSNHKYDATDYSIIDDNFGDLATFQTLAAEAHDRGIQLILDGVFNHTSSDSIYFDRYERYASLGACESHTSPYRDWYYFTDVAPGTGTCAGSTGIPNAATYESWWGYDSLPKLRATSQPVRDLIWANGTSSIGPYWIDQGAAGWRLDVGGDVDPGVTNDASNDYWEGFRAALHSVYTETYVVGEEWGNASSWLLGNEWDAVMNYQYSSAMLGFFRDTPFEDNDHNTGSSAGLINPLDPSELDERLLNWIERYPPEALYAMMNLLGSHDTNRPLFMLDHNAATGTDDTLLDNPNYDWSDAIQRLKGVAILQMTLPGAPTIYYGDEVGNIGPITYDGVRWQDDPYNRIPYPWLDQTGVQPFYSFLQSQTNQDALYNYYKLLADTRNANPALRTGSFDPLLSDDANGIYAYGRKLADHSNAAVVVMNRADVSQTVAVDVAGYLPYGTQFVNVLDSAAYTVTAEGLLVVEVAERSGALLIPTAAVDAPPAAVSDLAVTDENNAELVLRWSAALDASSYDIYRSLLSGGGYALVGASASTVFTDTGLTNATDYYYVVVSRNDSNGLVSGNSNEASGTPQHDLGSAWYNLQWPHEFEHTISTITPTQNIYGQLWINGFTGGAGPAEGIRAQVGYGISGTLTTEWQWVEMTYDQADNNNDQYVTTLLPDAVGDYHYATRWSSDGGATWHISDIGGPGDNGNYGLMHVIASDDVTAPNPPQNACVAGTTASSISLCWDANADPDLAGYDLYRQLHPPERLGPGGYVRIARLFGSPTSYTDTDVFTDQTYDYYLVAFDTSFNFSTASNIVTATAEPRVVSVTFQVTVPDFTPGTVYIAGSVPGIPSWNPGGQALQPVDSTHWTLTLPILDGTRIEYKFARGSWDTVEKEADGNGEIANRQATIAYGMNATHVISVTVANWRDPIVVGVSPADQATGVPVENTVSLAWSQAMPANSTFAVSGPAGAVAGTFAYDPASYTVTFTPTLALDANTTYTVTASGKQDAGGDNQQVPFLSTFHTVSPAEPRAVAVTFDVAVPDFTPGTVYISGTVGEQMLTQANSTHWTATLNILEDTVIEYVYTRGRAATLETAADGNAAIATRQVTITYGTDGTQLLTDTVANWLDPLVLAASPLDGAVDVPVTSTVSLTWSQAMPADSAFVLTGPAGVVTGTFHYDAATLTLTFTPTLALDWNTPYTITASALLDAGGDVQQVDFSASFTTAARPEEPIYYFFFPIIARSGTP